MLSLIVRDVIRETEDTRSYVLEEENGNPVPYEAGQFLTLVLVLNGRELRRSYSISSSPATDQRITITVKKVVNGEVSRFLLNHIRKGSRLKAVEPAGRFTIEPAAGKSRDIFLIAAGSGITPVFSLLKKLLSEEPGAHITLITQNRNESSVIFGRELSEMANRFKIQLQWYSFLGAPLNKSTAVQRLNVDILTELVNTNLKHDRKDALFYVCGPLSFMRMAEFTVKQLGFEDRQLRKEIFITPVLPPPSEELDTSPRKITLYFQDKMYSITLSYPSTILDAAWRNNIEIPFSCKAGICSTCVARCVEGKVKMRLNEVLTDKDIANGLVLTCVGYAETDLVLKFE
jgi:ring-1,2-phenylacetyl-CoA epoxidase subunit PaaE